MQSIDASTVLDVQQSFVHGERLASTGERFTTEHPASGRVICEVEQADGAVIEAAVASSAEGFAEWSSWAPVERQRALMRAVAIIRDRNDQLARLDTLDTGKPIAETSVEDVPTGADVIEFYAGLVPTLHGDTLDFPNGFARLRREPLGVCVGIGAWNYPIQIAMWKSGLALACGNAMIFKPAELTPLSALTLAEIYLEAGIPPGVFNVVQGDGRVGEALVRHPGVAKVSLTGEVTTGSRVMAAASDTLKAITLELGGKSPIVVFDDADLDSAVNAAVVNNFYSSGQVCSHGTRVFVQRNAVEAVCERVVAATERLTVGDPFHPDTLIGPLISAEHHAKVVGYLEAARSSGARHLIGGDVAQVDGCEGGHFVTPAAFAEATDDMTFVTDEVFGPLMSILAFDDEDEVLRRANATEYGLAAAVFTTDFARAHRVANRLEAGTVWINDYGTLPASVPFGGYKMSGIGRENGMRAIEHYTQVKMIYANLGTVEPWV